MNGFNGWENNPWDDGTQQDDWTQPTPARGSDWEENLRPDTFSPLPQPGHRKVGRETSEGGQQVQKETPNVYLGIAQDLQSSPNARNGFLSSWISSLIYGVPLCFGVSAATRNVFNLATQDTVDSMNFGVQRSVAVTFFGDSNTGLIGRGQAMEVHGKKGPDGSVYAETILNRTNGTRIRFNRGIPGNIVRVLTLLLVMTLVAVGLNATPVFQGVRRWVSSIDWGVLLLGTLAVAAGLLWLTYSLRRSRHSIMKGLGILALVGLCLMVPSLGFLVLMLVLMVLGIDYMIRGIR